MSEIDWAILQKDADELTLPDGEYNCIVKQADAVQSSTGKPMVKMKLAVLDGPKKDRLIFTQQTLSAENPFALKMWFTAMAAFGLGRDYFAGKPSMAQVAQDLTNRAVRVTIGTREWQGTPRNEVNGFKLFDATGPIPPGVVTGPPATPIASTPVVAGPPGAVTVPTPPITPAAPAAATSAGSAPPNQPF